MQKMKIGHLIMILDLDSALALKREVAALGCKLHSVAESSRVLIGFVLFAHSQIYPRSWPTSY